jgi:hypothetical protein
VVFFGPAGPPGTRPKSSQSGKVPVATDIAALAVIRK